MSSQPVAWRICVQLYCAGSPATGWRSRIDAWYFGDSITVSTVEAFSIVLYGRRSGDTPSSGPRNGKAIQKVTGTPFLVGILHSHLFPVTRSRRCDGRRRWSFITTPPRRLCRIAHPPTRPRVGTMISSLLFFPTKRNCYSLYICRLASDPTLATTVEWGWCN